MPPEDYGPWLRRSIRVTKIGDLPATDIKLQVVQQGILNRGTIDELEVYWAEEKREMESLGPNESKEWSVTILELPTFTVKWSHESIFFRKDGNKTLKLPWYLW